MRTNSGAWVLPNLHDFQVAVRRVGANAHITDTCSQKCIAGDFQAVKDFPPVRFILPKTVKLLVAGITTQPRIAIDLQIIRDIQITTAA